MCNRWRERNNRIFKGEDCSIIELRHIFLLAYFEWRTALSGRDKPPVLDFVDLCNFGQSFAFLVHVLCTKEFASFLVFSRFFNEVFIYQSKKKKKPEDMSLPFLYFSFSLFILPCLRTSHTCVKTEKLAIQTVVKLGNLRDFHNLDRSL